MSALSPTHPQRDKSFGSELNVSKFMKKKYHEHLVIKQSVHYQKTWRIMKTYLLLFILGITQVTAAVFSQNINIDLSLRNAPLKEAFEQIENKTDFKFYTGPISLIWITEPRLTSQAL
jgi:hypothetical protein